MNREDGIGVISVDNGGSSTCVVTRNTEEWFPSVKALYGERTLTTVKGKKDFIVEYKGEKYIMGTLAKYDSVMPLQMHTESKQNLFYDLSILVAIHQYGFLDNYLVTCVPVSMHNDIEKKGLYERLVKSHTIKVNGISRTFRISDLRVAAEGASAYWIDEPRGIARFLDIGSRTINFVTTLNEDGINRYLDSQSGVFFGQGIEALGNNYNSKGLSDFIGGRLFAKGWKREDQLFLLGGGALDKHLVEFIRDYFPLAKVIDDPVMANSKGMFQLGRHAYQMN